MIFGPSTVTRIILLYVATWSGIDDTGMTDARMIIVAENELLRPLRPTKRESLNLATPFSMSAVLFRKSGFQFSSLPAVMTTSVPSGISESSVTTLNAHGQILLCWWCWPYDHWWTCLHQFTVPFLQCFKTYWSTCLIRLIVFAIAVAVEIIIN